jgi:glycosyltransferase involved in cell wall biosynthesis
MSKEISNWIFVSTEDDKYCVKGGIGTYLGILVQSLQEVSPQAHIHWFTESNSNIDFTEIDGQLERHYLSRVNLNGEKLDIVDYSQRFEDELNHTVSEIIRTNPEARIVIEAPEWEGLLSNFYQADNPRILKISRNHTPLAVTAKMNDLELSGIFAKQVEKELQQMRNSDLLSCPTKYMLEETVQTMWPQNAPFPVPHTVIPNGINTELFYPDRNTRTEAINIFRDLTGVSIDEDNYNIFIIGSVEERKGIAHVLDAIPHVINNVPNARFYFIGHHQKDDGDNLTSNIKLTPKGIYGHLSPEYRDKVFFTDYLDHNVLPEIMEAGDLFPICYLGDNFPGVVAEIGLSQRPMAVFMRGGIPEMIEREGEPLAYHFSQTATAGYDLAKHIIKHYSDPTKALEIARQLRTHLIHKFSANNVTRQMIAQYSESLEAKL